MLHFFTMDPSEIFAHFDHRLEARASGNLDAEMTFITLLLVPVIYSIAVLDLKVVRWEALGHHELAGAAAGAASGAHATKQGSRPPSLGMTPPVPTDRRDPSKTDQILRGREPRDPRQWRGDRVERHGEDSTTAADAAHPAPDDPAPAGFAG